MPQNSLKLHTPFLKGGAPRQPQKGGPEAAASFASPNIHHWQYLYRWGSRLRTHTLMMCTKSHIGKPNSGVGLLTRLYHFTKKIEVAS